MANSSQEKMFAKQYRFCGSLEDVVRRSRKIHGKTLNTEQRKEDHKQHMKNFRGNKEC